MTLAVVFTLVGTSLFYMVLSVSESDALARLPDFVLALAGVGLPLATSWYAIRTHRALGTDQSSSKTIQIFRWVLATLAVLFNLFVVLIMLLMVYLYLYGGPTVS